jgi:hypothetical protein
MATVGDPGNPSVGVLQTFGLGGGERWVQPPTGTGIYKSCSVAPPSPKRCLTVGKVTYTYGIGEFETTVSQYVSFLNTVDPDGRNRHDLWLGYMKHGEAQERVMGLKMPPPNLQPDFEEQAKTFAGGLVDGILQPVAAKGTPS